MLAHNVFFQLKDDSELAQARLIAACKTHLAAHPGVVFFACGPLARDLAREVNDRDWHVALHLVFDSIKSHDDYQAAPSHLQFIEENRGNWAKVRVFDSLVEYGPPTA